MHPNGEELLRGIQSTLATYVLPEIQSDHARLEVMLSTALLGVAAQEWDGAAQRLVDDNAAARELLGRGADVIAAEGGAHADLAAELRTLASETDASVRLSDLSEANVRLQGAAGRLVAALEGGSAPRLRELRTTAVKLLQEQTEARALELLGARADG